MIEPEPILIREELAFEVAATNPVTETIDELKLDPLDPDPLNFLPGQYVLLEDSEHLRVPRSYSINNPPRPDGTISLLVTRVPGGQLSPWIHDQLKPGDRVSVSGPYGSFTADPAWVGPTLYLAAGSGLAPIRALLEARLAPASDQPDQVAPTTLIFSARTEADVIDRDRFEELSARHSEYHFVRTLTQGEGPPPHGRIPAQLGSLCGDLSDHQVFIAGAPGFVTACAEAAQAAEAKPERIHTELFFVEM